MESIDCASHLVDTPSFSEIVDWNFRCSEHRTRWPIGFQKETGRLPKVRTASGNDSGNSHAWAFVNTSLVSTFLAYAFTQISIRKLD